MLTPQTACDQRTDIHRGSACVLEGIADSVTCDRGLVPLRALGVVLAKEARLGQLLGIVPGAAGVGHHDAQHVATANGRQQQPNEGALAKAKADNEWREDGQCAGNDHLNDGRPRRNVDAPDVLGTDAGGTLPEARDIAELAPDLDNHGLCGAAHRQHRQGAKEVGQHDANEDRHDHVNVHKGHHIGVGHMGGPLNEAQRVGCQP